ncbi:type II toxin-antitoxin system PemK/MazF family toxin [Actinomycetospora endophytica]|uniref:Type II toxin-antitoxin system PemK/MazF family toxin n=1 Tax=Actinomycetospora endophytica TaxID=2291215 RepID=A0ABS8PCB7_9PSEU|nr:type II toxin-antitoxin system PemK/MazF family toxin [Actinomycetospora endophytica]MCD2195915.1 type II toxin-antitoxin system PemK/MazF family toxin [Actinomycetospora endophytica]
MANFGDFVNRAVQVGLDLLTSSGDNDGGRRKPAGPPPPLPGQDRNGGVRTVPSSERAREISYAPDMDGAADPGEIVWTWVPFEEDASQGKDRPVLVVARASVAGELLGLMLSSQGHRADDANWLPIGSGPWDREGRDSYIRLDRVLEVPEHGIRREGATMPRDRFDAVANALRGSYGWH